MKKKKSIKMIIKKSTMSLLNAIPMMFGIMLLIGIMKTFISFESLASIFTENKFIDTILGSLLGSILAGNSINSYIIGHEMIGSGISLFAVTAFLVSWVTVGFLQLPAEKELLGTRFTLTRNFLSIFLSIVVALLTVWTLGVIS